MQVSTLRQAQCYAIYQAQRGTLSLSKGTSGSGIFGFNQVIDTSDHNYFILKDHLGSVMTIADEDGDAVEFLSYDACSVKHGFCEARTKTDVELTERSGLMNQLLLVNNPERNESGG